MGYPQDNSDIKEKYKHYLSGKKVCIVGPAPKIIGSSSGEVIDSYDIVVRLNNGYMFCDKHREDIGMKMNIIYQTAIPKLGRGVTMPIEKLQNKVKWVCCSYPDEKHRKNICNFIKYVDNRIFMHIMNRDRWGELSLSIGGQVGKGPIPPTTGLAAIVDLLYYDIERLYITGFTFFKVHKKRERIYYRGYGTTPSYETPANLKDSKHNFKAELGFFKNIIKSDSRVDYDNVLKKVVKGI
jgi:hypothetical protein